MMKIKGYNFKNFTKTSWFDYYLDLEDGNEQYVIDSYGTKEELSGICQMSAQVCDEQSKNLADVHLYLFDGMRQWIEVGFENCTEEFKNKIVSLGAGELDVDGIGFYPEHSDIDTDAFESGDTVKVFTQLADYLESLEHKEPELEKELDEKIVKKGSKWQVQSEKGRNLGTYDTKEEAEERLKQVHYFKHINENFKYINGVRFFDSVYELKDFILNNKNHFLRIVDFEDLGFYGVDFGSIGTHDGICSIAYENGLISDNSYLYDDNAIVAYPVSKEKEYLDGYYRPIYVYHYGDLGIAEVGGGGYTFYKSNLYNVLGEPTEEYKLDDEDESLNEDNSKYVFDVKDFEQWCKDNLSSDINLNNYSYFIFNDGNLYCSSDTHDTILRKYLISKGQRDEEDVWGYLQKVVREYGAIRCAGDKSGAEHYVHLPENSLSNQQYETLTKWLDYYSQIFNDVHVFQKGHNFKNKVYSYKENTVDEIIKKIKRLYTTGVLVDSFQEDLQETDNEGNILSQEQIEFFKNSKVRDRKGNLCVCYHGTNKDFNTFDKSLLGTGEGTVWGKGFYFFKGKNSEANASEYGSTVKKVYVNITNPIKEEPEMFAKLLKFNYPEADTEDFEKFRERYWDDYNDEYILSLYVQRKLKVKVDDLEDLFLKMVTNAGYDGRIVDNEVICYEPNQIKSIFNKNPTNSNNINEDINFDLSYDDIMSDDELDALDKKERDEFEARLKARRDKVASDRLARDEKIRKEPEVEEMNEDKKLTEAPDEYGLPTDDEIRADIEKEFEQRKADRDAAKKVKDDEKAVKVAKEQRTAELKAKAEDILKDLGEHPTFEDLFDKLVPDNGASESLGGELIRAVNRLDYRNWNDGDRFFDGYGLETCGSPAAFICDNVEEFGKNSYNDIDMIIRNCAENNLEDEDYDNFIEELKTRIVKLVTVDHPELLATPLGEKDIHSWTDGEEYWKDYIPRYEYEITASEKIQQYLERGDLDSWEVIDWIKDWENSDSRFRDIDVDTPWSSADDTYTITNLTKDGYEAIQEYDRNDTFWNDLEERCADDYGPITDINLEDECYDELNGIKLDGYSIRVSGVTIEHNSGKEYTCSFDLDVNDEYLDNVSVDFEVDDEGYLDNDAFVMDASAAIKNCIDENYDVLNKEEDTDELLDTKHGDVENAPFVVQADDEKFAFDTKSDMDAWKERNKHSFNSIVDVKCGKDDEIGHYTSESLKEGKKEKIEYVVISKDSEEMKWFDNEEEAISFAESHNEAGEVIEVHSVVGSDGEIDYLEDEEKTIWLDESLKEKKTKKMSYEDALAKLYSGDWDNERFNDAIMDGEVEMPKDDESLKEATHAKSTRPNGNKITAFNNALKLAKEINKDVVYGYTSKKNPTKFFEIKPVEYDGDDNKFRKKYGASVIYVAYPDKEFIKESLTESFDKSVLSDCDAWYVIAKYDGEDFMIVDSWEDVQKIQKCIDPNFEPKDRWDSSVLDNAINWGFSDSYTTCEECGDVICTEPDSKHWVADFFVSDYGIECGDCVRNNPQEYIQSLINNPRNANTILDDSDLEYEGFEKLEGDYQSGWYDRHDDPEDILSDLLDKYPYGEFIFSVTSNAQFATNFEVWARSESLEVTEDESLKESDKENVIHIKSNKMKTVKMPDHSDEETNPTVPLSQFSIGKLKAHSSDEEEPIEEAIDDVEHSDLYVDEGFWIVIDYNEEGETHKKDLYGPYTEDEVGDVAEKLLDRYYNSTYWILEPHEIDGLDMTDVKVHKNKKFSLGYDYIKEGVVGGKRDVEITREMLIDLEKKVYDYLNKNNIYPEDGTFSKSSNPLADLELELIIDGDWKHDHLFAEHLVEKFCEENGMIVVKHSVTEVGESESDWYTGDHIWFIDFDDGEGKQRLDAFRKVFN